MKQTEVSLNQADPDIKRVALLYLPLVQWVDAVP